MKNAITTALLLLLVITVYGQQDQPIYVKNYNYVAFYDGITNEFIHNPTEKAIVLTQLDQDRNFAWIYIEMNDEVLAEMYISRQGDTNTWDVYPTLARCGDYVIDYRYGDRSGCEEPIPWRTAENYFDVVIMKDNREMTFFFNKSYLHIKNIALTPSALPKISKS